LKKYNVSGMSCAACSARVQKAVEKVEGVKSCSVNLLTNSMIVEGDASDESIISAVNKAGYGAATASDVRENDNSKIAPKENKDKADNVLLTRLIFSALCLLILMYISMGHVMWGAPLPTVLSNNPLGLGMVQMLLSAIIMVINQKFFINGFKGLIHLAPNMDTLVSLGSLSAFLYSAVLLFIISGSHDTNVIHEGLHGLYFESSAMVLTLITLGKLLESRAKGRTTNAIKELMDLTPKTATIVKDNKEITVSVDKVKIGDIFIVKPGESIPVDGVVIDGSSSIDESALTGESIPVDKDLGDEVSAATINRSGALKCEARRVGEDTTLSQIIKIVNDASATKAPIAKIADKVSGVFVPIVIGISIITLIIWMIISKDFGFSLARAISVLVISCPCALGLATPVAIMVGSGVGARHGVLFKNATALETLGKTNIIALDKTGTVTNGEPEVTDIIPAEGVSETKLLSVASCLEKNSEHPLAKAIMNYCVDLNIENFDIKNFESMSGSGVKAEIDGTVAFGGTLELIQNEGTVSDKYIQIATAFSDKGKTPLYFSHDYKFLGLIVVADTIRADSKDAINSLKQIGKRVVMLTGDNERTAKAIANEAGINEVIAGIKPDQKEAAIRELQKDGRVCMVGDGINDAPALTRANVGIAIGNGTDIAIESADVVVIKSRLTDVVSAIRISKATTRNIYENLFWAFGYNIIGIPLAAGAFIPLFNWQLEPMFGAAAMSISSFLVVSNALRLNYIRLKDKKVIKNKEIKTMKKTIYVTGMMCMHCEARVKKILEGIPGISSVEVDHKSGTAIVTLSSDVQNSTIVSAIEADGYKVTSIK